MSKLTVSEFLETVDNNYIFTVEFTKRTNGERRVMNCRRGVTKGVKGVGMNYRPADKNLLTVFDMQKGGFRSVNLEDLISLKANGRTYTWSTHDSVFIETVKD